MILIGFYLVKRKVRVTKLRKRQLDYGKGEDGGQLSLLVI
jgi:hypothetical protein